MKTFLLKAMANVPRETVEAVGRDLMPHMKTPVFQLPFGLEIAEVVIVAFRAPSGVPVHGGVFAVFCGELIELVLVDEFNRVDTSHRPAYAAFQVSMGFGDLLFSRDGVVDRVNWSVLEIGGRMERCGHGRPEEHGVRRFVRDEYMKLLIPRSIGMQQLI